MWFKRRKKKKKDRLNVLQRFSRPKTIEKEDFLFLFNLLLSSTDKPCPVT